MSIYTNSMGRAKELWMEIESDPFYGVSDKLASVHLLKNNLVHDAAMEVAFDGVCSYCGDFTKVVRLRTLVEIVDEIVLRYFGEPDNEGVGWDSHFEKDIPGFHDEGGGYIVPDNRKYFDSIKELFFEYGLIVDSDDLEDDIADALGYHFCLIEKDPYGLNPSEERWVDWRIIKKSAIKMAQAGKALDEMEQKEAARLDYLKSDIYSASIRLQIETDLTLYRTVNYQKEPIPLTFGNLTSPPVQFTQDLRMSQKGDSVFYGAYNKDTALKEAMSNVNDEFTYISKFQTKHPLRLLDLTGIPEQLCIFNQKQYHLLLFLRAFCNAISEYVPDHDAIYYAPTQLITYYFRHKLRHYVQGGANYPIDGIQYRSSKDNTINAVLFYDNVTSSQHLDIIECECIHQGALNKVKVV